MQGRQIFQTSSATRWQRVQWGSRFFLLLLLLAIVTITIALWRDYSPTIPRMQQKALAYKKVLDPNEKFIYKSNALVQKYQGYRQFFNQKTITNSKTYAANKQSMALSPQLPCSIRSAFYVAWDPQSFFSLQRNISKLNMVIPEWMFIDPTADTLFTNVDARAYEVMKKSGVRIMPILSNNFKEKFYGDAVQRIITNPVKRERLINDVLNILQKNNFVGVNVDLEELQQNSDEAFVAFQKELYTRLHQRGFMVTQDIIPFNEDYNYTELAKYNDYLFVMAYDQFSEGTAPGPIAEQKWIEAAIDEAAKKIDPSKLILGLGAYGYDWPKNDAATVLTYQQALTTAKESDGKIKFDNDSYNLHYNYYDDANIEHDVYFTDAATTFNAMRFATEYGLGGVSLWRLGSEDSRVWKFYDKSMTKEALQSFDFKAFTKVTSTDDVDYIGNGEVLDVKATPTDGSITPQIDSTEMLITEEDYTTLPSMFVVQKYGTDNPKKLVLTFDDGPDPRWTPKILDILSQKHVPATFFIVGINAENNIPLVKRIYREGHEIGNHTFTHPNIAEVSRKRAVLEMEATRLLIECITGHSTILFRAPYNADFEPEKMEELLPVAIARSKNYLDVGESIDALDWTPDANADSIVQRVINRKQELNQAGQSGNIILLHDAGGNSRAATIAALPRIIDYFQKRGYTFTTVADILNKKKDDLMPPVPPGSGFYLMQANYALAEFGYWCSNLLFSLFIVFIFLSAAKIAFMAWLAVKENKKEKRQHIVFPMLPAYPLVSIIVPAYNEEVNAVQSLQNLLKSTYPNFEILFVDDGSKDNTYEKVNDIFATHPKVKVFTKPNGGKASALNFGIRQSQADYVVCIDADTHLKPDAVAQLMKHFLTATENIGAVAGNVKVGNERNMLTRWQAIEYISSQNFDRRAFAYLNAITVVPGAIGAFKKEAIEKAGGFTTDTLAEDCDLTIRILRAGYVVKNENEAIALTEAPERLKQLIKQRFRWSFGVLQTFWKHHEVLFNKKFGALGWVALPNILLFQYIIPSIIPLADLFMLIGIVSGNVEKIAAYYFAFMLIDAGVAILAFRMEKEKLGRLIWLIPQRLIYRWLMWYVLFKSIRRAFKGELQNWGVLKRTGNVKEIVAR